MKCISRHVRKKQEINKGAEVLATVITMICYIIHRDYGWDKDQLQKLIDDVYTEIIKADKGEVDWIKGVEFWRDRMGLRI
jgi:hypothetical protein